jgi:hypothetical protein
MACQVAGANRRWRWQFRCLGSRREYRAFEFMNRSLFPKHQETPRTVRVRVVRSTIANTVVRTLEIPTESWSFVTSRLPTAWAVDTEVTMTVTPMELEWMQGKRDLDETTDVE